MTENTPPSRRYHHGNLRAALIAEALDLARQGGIDAVSVREVTRRAGVSPGALFRHFADKTALMTAVAEEAIEHFHHGVMNAVTLHTGLDSAKQLRAIGRAFLAWAVDYPVHFEIISQRRAINFDQSEKLIRLNREIQQAVEQVLSLARQEGRLRVESDLASLQIMARAQVYGLARMYIDGHFPSWGIDQEKAEKESERLLDLFLEALLGKG